MDLFKLEQTVQTKPCGIKVQVTIIGSEYVCGRDQYCVLRVDNPDTKCEMRFMPGLKDYKYDPKYLGDQRLVIGANTTLHGYSENDLRTLSQLMIEEFCDSVHYYK
jgi:hypothetical protein